LISASLNPTSGGLYTMTLIIEIYSNRMLMATQIY
jgi:hypothetical protein